MTQTQTDVEPSAAEEHDEIALYDADAAAAALAEIYATGDLAKLAPRERVAYYLELCRSLGLNSLSRPFDWLVLDSRLVLYPNKSCAEQLRRQHQISIKVLRRDIVGDLFVVEVEGRTPSGRTDQASKYVPLTGYNKQSREAYRLKGADLANAFAKAETGAKRRLVLSMIGLSSAPDLEDVRTVRYVVVDAEGQVLDNPSEEQRHLAERPTVAKVLGEPTFESVAGSAVPPVAATASQAATPDELERPKPPTGPKPSFRASDEDVKRHLGAWFGAVKSSSLDDDDVRHRFVAAWTLDIWPPRKRTESLRTFFARATDDEAAELLAHARTLVAAERAELLEDAASDAPDDQPRPEQEPF